MSNQVEPSLCDIYARCLDIVQRLTCISSVSYHGLTAEEFRDLEQIANDLLGLYMNISYRQSHDCVPCDSDVDDVDSHLPF